ncbi:hypothetical protein ACFX1Q_015207 [Malus domestica]
MKWCFTHSTISTTRGETTTSLFSKTSKLSSKSRRIKKALFVLHQIFLQDQALTALEESRSSFFVHHSSKIKPRRPLGSTIIHLQDQAPTAP